MKSVLVSNVTNLGKGNKKSYILNVTKLLDNFGGIGVG